ncbi:hypothetical protein JCM33374_g5485 [Metschnikowia sp. JCM 33374]|nr:hypothetical protein JCM33374_g5485 [Metschnikowia sp. JCM 33374]
MFKNIDKQTGYRSTEKSLRSEDLTKVQFLKPVPDHTHSEKKFSKSRQSTVNDPHEQELEWKNEYLVQIIHKLRSNTSKELVHNGLNVMIMNSMIARVITTNVKKKA